MPGTVVEVATRTGFGKIKQNVKMHKTCILLASHYGNK